ncbi:MAG TPA: hypothetical protein VHH55_01980 [Gaiellaceae bacterium]|nr:hypothetical protein [Gaiellaceae bacterium]
MPRERPFYGVAHLVLGGVAARLELTVEHLEELELALDGLLDRREAAGEVELVLRLRDDGLEAELGPFGKQLRTELDDELGESLSIRRLLDAVVDDYALLERDGATWIELRKQTTSSASA